MIHKRWMFMLASCVGLFGCLTFVLSIYYRYKLNNIDYKQWDLDTVTINDYSVEMEIDDKLYQEIDKVELLMGQNQNMTEGSVFIAKLREYIAT